MFRLKQAKTKLMVVQILAIVPFLLFIFYLFDLWFQTNRSNVLEENLNQAKLLALYINDNLNHGLKLAKSVARSPDFMNIYNNNPELVRRTIRSLVDNNPELSSMYILNKEGIVIQFESSMQVNNAIGTSVTDRDYYQQIMETHKSYVSDPLVGKLTGTKIVTMGDPVIVDNEVAAIVVSSIDLKKLTKQMEKHMETKGLKYIYILDKKGNLTVSPFSDNIEVDNQEIFKNEAFFNEVSKGNDVLLDNKTMPILNDNVLGAAVRVEDFGWTVISFQRTIDIFSPLFKVQAVSWLIILCSLSFAILVISYHLKKIRIIF
ncbi:hypothetical protein A3J20_03520 [Candidatus Gottesmanbacteria bacterium RIFCSPLOWO2_02_FULL_42_29]|uniref:Cache domain-containing protein n=2 Tax=Candidatus Gottesmaniibacteriota TaxID=1752720 RepID=A0A1F6BDP3_9BACT|nr:MAG: Signal transduction histidine kinase [Candidatus Gottesmanbacteria bacterium GW2011_GWA2_42_18]OGG12244.1 MAG: hypothetical protein A2781_05000 [Candidatus Gottesmanbacteria bacterium RIFCSPHIGHO2_01_FULL_42_27]OGG21732.1 MAG: hypothetical protein A3E72_04665 [Candidatus Gottesmanbacteria bacterium RIFCSPHIGHO2_12_FULL_43_26]OGG34731.1 MAG: hypothetical protein A3G68_01690 [Candidatus Gottesmanbacteria bacterium RIFCSPLOWO2_12_FULL_42_10]OGG35069.1 MAG: hypothetical protein A2968_00365 